MKVARARSYRLTMGKRSLTVVKAPIRRPVPVAAVQAYETPKDQAPPRPIADEVAGLLRRSPIRFPAILVGTRDVE